MLEVLFTSSDRSADEIAHLHSLSYNRGKSLVAIYDGTCNDTDSCEDCAACF